ncbi:MAG: FxLYD domain-containing protein, partial [Thermomicrobiales bacterium]
VLEQVYDRPDPLVHAWVLDIRNETDLVSSSPTLTLTFFDDAGNILGEEIAGALLDSMLPGELTPFIVEFYGEDPDTLGWSTIGVMVQGTWPYDEYATSDGLVISETAEKSEERAWSISGKVTNDTATPQSNVRVVAIVRDHGGDFLGSTWDAVMAPIDPGKWAKFTCDAGFKTIVPYDPFKFGHSASDFAVQLVASRPVV